MKGSDSRHHWTLRRRLIGLILLISIPFFLFPGYEFLVYQDHPLPGLIFIAAAGLLAIGSGVLFSRTIENPLRELTRAARAIADGDLTVRLPEQPDDELGELAESFNRMVAALEASRAEAAQAYALSQARARSLDALAEQLQDLHALSLATSPASQLGTPGGTLDDLYRSIAASCARLGYCGALLYLVDETGHELYLAATAGGRPEAAGLVCQDEVVTGLNLSQARFPLDASDNLLVRCVRTGESFHTPHLHDLARPLLEPETSAAVQRAGGLSHWGGVPLRVREQSLGVLVVSAAEGVISDDDLATLSRFASQAAMAIVNARLTEAERSTRQNLSALVDISDPALATLPLDALLQALIERLVRGSSAAAGAILLRENNHLSVCAAVGLGDQRVGDHASHPYPTVPVGEGFSGHILAEGHMVVIPDVASEPIPASFHSPLLEGVQEGRVRALLGAPLTVGERVIGVAYIGMPAPHRFSQNEVDRLQVMAHRAAQAIENARLQEERQRRMDELALLHEATMALSQSLQLDRLANALAQVLERLLPYEYAEVFLIEEATGELIPILVRERHHTDLEVESTTESEGSASRRTLGEGISGWVAQHNQVVRLGDVRGQSDPPYIAQRPDIRSILCAPLHIGKWAVGAIKLESVELNAYSEHHERLLMALAGQLAVAIENARLFREIGQRAAELAHRNLDLAALLDLSQSLTLTLEPERLYEIVLAQAVAAIAPAAGAMLWLYNPLNDALELVGVHGYDSGGQWSVASDQSTGHWLLANDHYRLRPGEATIGAVYASGTPLRLTSAADFEAYRAIASPTLLQIWDTLGRAQQPDDRPLPPLVSEICVPLAAHGQIIGCLSLDAYSEPVFSEADLSLLQAIANQAAVAIENARLFAAITDSREQLRTLSAQIVQAQEEERRRLARELHDEIGQALTAVTLDLGVMARSLPKANQTVQRAIADAHALSQNALEEVRRLSVELHPSILDDLGLVPALRWYIDRHAERTGMQSHFQEIGLDERLPAEIETVCYRAVQEALTNIARHASAHSVSVCLERERVPDNVSLTITDDGVGFDVSQALRRARAGHSVGLLGLRERVELLGGSLQIRSRSGEGTRIQIQLPFPSLVVNPQSDD